MDLSGRLQDQPDGPQTILIQGSLSLQGLKDAFQSRKPLQRPAQGLGFLLSLVQDGHGLMQPTDLLKRLQALTGLLARFRQGKAAQVLEDVRKVEQTR
jgi:hypothetical protein